MPEPLAIDVSINLWTVSQHDLTPKMSPDLVMLRPSYRARSRHEIFTAKPGISIKFSRHSLLTSVDSTKGPVRVADRAPRRNSRWFLLATLFCAFDDVSVLVICVQLLELANLVMRGLGSTEDGSVTSLNWT